MLTKIVRIRRQAWQGITASDSMENFYIQDFQDGNFSHRQALEAIKIINKYSIHEKICAFPICWNSQPILHSDCTFDCHAAHPAHSGKLACSGDARFPAGKRQLPAKNGHRGKIGALQVQIFSPSIFAALRMSSRSSQAATAHR